MVTAIEIKPAALLQPFVHCYALRTFNTGDMLMPKPLHALNECFMTFFLKDKFCYMVNETGNVKRAVSNNIYCLFTQPAGCSYYKGDFTLFAVEFKANGLFAIFGVPQRILLNTLLTVEDILGSDNCLVTEQLESSKNLMKWLTT